MYNHNYSWGGYITCTTTTTAGVVILHVQPQLELGWLHYMYNHNYSWGDYITCTTTTIVIFVIDLETF